MFEFPTCIALFSANSLALSDSGGVSSAVVYLLLALCAGLAIGCVVGLSLKKRVSADGVGSILIRSEASDFLLLRYGKDGSLEFVSKGINALLGVPSTEFVNGTSTLSEFVHESDLPLLSKAAELRSEMRNETLQFQYRLRGPGNRWHWVHERLEPILARNGQVIAYESLLTDFSDRLRFEEKQRRLLEMQRMITSVVDAFGDSDSLSDEAVSCLDYVSHYLRLHAALLVKLETADEGISVLSSVGAAKDSTSPIPITEKEAKWWVDQLRIGEPLELSEKRIQEIPSSLRSGFQRCISGNVLVFPIVTDAGLTHAFILESEESQRMWEPEEIAGIRSAAEAVSRRIEQLITQRDREQFSEKRANIERSEAISHFINGIIHDFNNLIFAVSGKLSLMTRKSSDPEMTKSMEEVRGLVSDAGGILQRLIHAGRLGLDDVTCIDPWSEMSQIMRTAQRLLPRRISFDYTLEGFEGTHDRCIKAVPQTLQQLVLNLVVNARDAIGKDGQIRVEGKPSEDRKRFVVTVHDDGPGIPDDLRDEAMKPYHSTKVNGSSLGLGLSICRRVVSDAHGTFELDVSPLGGLMAKAEFPLVKGEEPEILQSPQTLHSISGSVFLIEDVPEIQTVLERELEMAGATVISRPDAIDAEEVIREYGDDIVLMVFDIDLPQRTGIECLSSLRSQGVHTPCLLITGGATQPPNIEGSGFLRKPFTPEVMFDSIQALMMNEVDTEED